MLVEGRVKRIVDVLTEIGADFAVLTSHDAVSYATGHVAQIELGPSPFAGGPALAVIGRDGSAGLLRSNAELSTAPELVQQEVYGGLENNRAVDLCALYASAFANLARRLHLGGTVAIQAAGFPYSLWAIASGAASGGIVSLDDALSRTRAIKTPQEIELLTWAAHIAAAGQEAVRRLARSPCTEIGLFGEVRAEIERSAGERCAVYCDLLSGVARTADIGGSPTARSIGPLDPLVVDLAPRVDGYWGDSCGSFCLGQPSESYERMFRVVREGLDLAASEIRPGMSITAFDAKLRSFISGHGYAFPHHAGHSIGTSVHEFPRIVSYDQGSFESGMMMMVEPGAYHPDIGGIRLEWMFEITASGARPVADFPLHPSLGRVGEDLSFRTHRER